MAAVILALAAAERGNALLGADGYALLDALDLPDTPAALQALPTVAVLRRVWARHYERVAPATGGPGDGGGTIVRQRALRTRGPDDRVESPYDPDARFRGRGGREWVGYLVHLTETCDEGAPRLLVHADTTEASVHEAMRVEAIHTALAAKDLTPSEHLADAAYMSAELLVAARERHGIDLVRPQRRNTAWQSKEDGAFEATDFTVDGERQVVRCPEGKASTSWKVYSRPGRARGRPFVYARFHPWDCRACPARPRCTRSASAGRLVSLFPQREHEALAAARARERTAEYRGRYAQRQGIEATMSQAVRDFGLRQARYRGLVKTGLQHVATAAAINLDRLAAWLAERPLAPTRTSRFAAITV